MRLCRICSREIKKGSCYCLECRPSRKGTRCGYSKHLKKREQYLSNKDLLKDLDRLFTDSSWRISYIAKKHNINESCVNQVFYSLNPKISYKIIRRGKPYLKKSKRKPYRINLLYYHFCACGKLTYKPIYCNQQCKTKFYKLSPEKRQLLSEKKKKWWTESKRAEARRRRLKEIGVPVSNPMATFWFKWFDCFNNTKGEYRDLNNGDREHEAVGYSLDYINHELKVIIEWDEEIHFYKNGTLKPKDIKRQMIIQEYYPKYEFLRIRQRTFVKRDPNYWDLDNVRSQYYPVIILSD